MILCSGLLNHYEITPAYVTLHQYKCEALRLVSFKREHKLFWSRVMNCDATERLAAEEVPARLPHYTYYHI